MSSASRPTVKRQYGSRKPATSTPVLSIDPSSSSSQQAPSSSPSRVTRPATSSVSSSAWMEALQDSAPSSDLDSSTTSAKGKQKESFSSTPPTSSQSTEAKEKRSMRERKSSPAAKETKKPSSDLRSFFSLASPPSKRRRLSPSPPSSSSDSLSMSRQTSSSSSTSASSSSTIASSLSARSSSRSKPVKLSQLYLDPFDTPGRSTLSCAICSLSYCRTPEDLNFHEKFHKKCVGGIEWGNLGDMAKGVSLLEEGVEWEGKEKGKVLMVDWKIAEPSVRKRLNDVMETIDTELSSTSLTTSQLDSSKFFLFVTPSRKVVACAIVQRIQEAYQVVVPTSTVKEEGGKKNEEGLIQFGEDSSSIFCSPTPLPTILGVHRIWTSTSSRRAGLAWKLLDHMAQSYVYACPVVEKRRRVDVAFSQPTGKGMDLARRWTGTKEFKVFVD